MPPTEIDSIWFSNDESNKLYLGHLFLTGAHRLRVLASLAGFNIKERIGTDVRGASIFLGIFFYPFIVGATLLAYWMYKRKNPQVPREVKRSILWEHVKLNVSFKTVFCKHLFWVLGKEVAGEEKIKQLKVMNRGVTH